MGHSGRALRGAARTNNEDGDDVKRQVDSDINNQLPIYLLADVKTGGGKLIELIKAHGGSGAGRSASGTSSGSFNGLTASVALCEAAGDEAALDSQIRALVRPLLYNDGRGKWVSLRRLWRWRMGLKSQTSAVGHEAGHDGLSESSGGKHFDDDEQRVPQEATAPNRICGGYNNRRRLVCWKLEERGFVGETVLHICFLLSTPTHMILAQKLLAMFPPLINDIYLCDQYFGESCLHMAIVNESVRVVKLLLDHGAYVHERCLGTFFLPNDQKNTANAAVKRALARADRHTNCRSDEQSSHDERLADTTVAPQLKHSHRPPFGPLDKSNKELGKLDLERNHFDEWQTNYQGYVYWGEYPLSFAVSLGLADIYKLLLAKGANPNKQDSNGNTTLHIAVLANRVDMFDLCYANGANLNIANQLNLIPLTLAAKLERVVMFFHILSIQRQINWIFCRVVGFVEMPLDDVDTIDARDGTFNGQAALSLVVSGSSNEHLQMLDGFVGELLHVKWHTSLRAKFNIWVGLFGAFLLIAAVAYVTRLNKRQFHNNVRTLLRPSPARPVGAASTPSSSSSSSTYLAPQNSTLSQRVQTSADSPPYQAAPAYEARVATVNAYSELLVVLCVICYLSLLYVRNKQDLEADMRRLSRANTFRSSSCSVTAAADDDDDPCRQHHQQATAKTNWRTRASVYWRSLELWRLSNATPELTLFTLTCLLVLCCLPLRALGLHETEDICVALIMFVLPLKMLFFCRASTSLGPFLATLYRILSNVALCFVAFLFVFIGGFSQSFWIIFRTHKSLQAPEPAQANNATSPPTAPPTAISGKNYFTNMFDAVITMHMMALNEFSVVFDEFVATQHENLARFMFVVYMILMSILFVNMVIAMMGKIYQDISAQPNESLRQWARVSLVIERLCSSRNRLRMLDSYSHTRASGSQSPTGRASSVEWRFYGSTWTLSDKDTREIELVRHLTHQNQLNAPRLKSFELSSGSNERQTSAPSAEMTTIKTTARLQQNQST